MKLESISRSKLILIYIDYSAKMEKILVEMRSLLAGLNLTPGQKPTPLESISDILEGFPKLPLAEVLQGLSMPIILRTNMNYSGLEKLTNLGFDSRMRLEVVVETKAQIMEAAPVQVLEAKPSLATELALVNLPLSVLFPAQVNPSLVHLYLLKCERLIPTTSSRIIFNHIKLLEGWCNDLDWCQQITIFRIGIRKKIKRIERN